MKEKLPIESNPLSLSLIIPAFVTLDTAFKGLESADHMLPKLVLGLGAIGVAGVSIAILFWIKGRNRK